MKKILKIILFAGLALIILMIFSAIIKLCPPQGPWPMPPWCESNGISEDVETEATIFVSIPYNTPSTDIIYLEPIGSEPIKMTKVGILSYSTSIKVKGKDTLKYRYKSSSGFSDEFTHTINQRDQKIFDGVSGWTNLKFKPNFPEDFKFGAMMFDTWGRNYNFKMIENTRNNIDSSFKRLSQLGLKQVFVTEMLRADYNKDDKDPNSIDYEIKDAIFSDDLRDEAFTTEDMKNLAATAHKYGLAIGSEIGIGFVDFGKYIGSKDISSEALADYKLSQKDRTKEWVKDFYDKKEAKYLELADRLSSAGFDLMFINQRGNINNAPYDSYANERLNQIIRKIKEKYNIKVGVFVFDWNPFDEEWNKNYDFYKNADEVYMIIEKIEDRYQPTENMDFGTIKDKFSKELDDIGSWAKKNNIRLNIYFGPLSYKDSLVKGSIEFNDIRNPKIKALKRDWQGQADAYEAFLEAAEDRDFIKSINFMLFWWDDAMDPETSKTFVSISSSPRNKNAEAVIMKWAKAL